MLSLPDDAAAAPGRAARPPGRRLVLGAVALGVILAIGIVAIGVVAQGRQRALHTQLLTLPADAVARDPALLRLARAEAPPVYAAQCAGCHGADLRGRIDLGTPDLRAGDWLFGSGRVFDIERTILYGVRAGGRSRNVTEMPAFGSAGLLQPAEIRSVVAYVRALSGHGGDPAGTAAGRALYLGRGGCADCHGADALGSGDYGAPNLTTGHFAHGGSPDQLYDSIYGGRHGMMPGAAGTLSLEQIRALAVWIFASAHPGDAPS